MIRPRAAYLAARTENLPAVASVYRVEPSPQMVRMWVDRGTFRPYPAEVARLLPVEVGDLNRLYQLGFTTWLPPSAVAEGVYYGIRVGGRLVAAAGTHVISPEARLGVVGNVMTHANFRGRGYATAVTGAVTADLLRFCDQVVLNVRSDNAPALQVYRALGYREHVRFEERLIHRNGGALRGRWRALPGPIRRLLRARRQLTGGRVVLAPGRTPGPLARSAQASRGRWTSGIIRRHARRPRPIAHPHAGDPACHDHPDLPAAPRRHRPRPRRRGRPPDRVGRARDARPPAHP